MSCNSAWGGGGGGGGGKGQGGGGDDLAATLFGMEMEKKVRILGRVYLAH